MSSVDWKLPVSWRVDQAVGWIRIDAPPVNGLGYAVRIGLLEAFESLQADPAIRLIVIHGTERFFSAGADVREFGTTRATLAPVLPEVLAAIEASPVPVVAAIRGACLGGGLELALACHARLVHGQALLGLPEVQLGLIPGAGGTQRLPRLIGVQAAAELIIHGKMLAASDAVWDRACDLRIAPDTDWDQALEQWLRAWLAHPRPFERARDREATPLSIETVESLELGLVQQYPEEPARRVALHQVAQVGQVPYEKGLAAERTAFLSLVTTARARALRRLFLARRASASKDAQVLERQQALARHLQASLAEARLRDEVASAEVASHADRPNAFDSELGFSTSPRVLALLTQTACIALENGLAASVAEIDVCSVNSLGFAHWRGGLFNEANAAGPYRLLQWLRTQGISPSNLLQKQAFNGKLFE